MLVRRLLYGSIAACLLMASGCGENAYSPPDALVVAGDGVLTRAPDGSTSEAFFGTSEGDVVAEVAKALGDPTDTGLLEDCSSTAAHLTYPGITLVLSDGIFVGWRLRPDGAPPIRTSDGIGLGSTRSEVEARYPQLTVDADSSLSVEFDAGGVLSGAFDGASADPVVEELWAGEVCIAS